MLFKKLLKINTMSHLHKYASFAYLFFLLIIMYMFQPGSYVIKDKAEKMYV